MTLRVGTRLILAINAIESTSRRKFCVIAGLLFAAIPQTHSGENWPQFRGPDGLGIAASGDSPVHFGPSSHVLWKTALPSGNSSPCIWGNRIFLTTFDRTQLETVCLDRAHGKILWRQPAPAEHFEPTQRLGNPATPPAATDGARVDG